MRQAIYFMKAGFITLAAVIAVAPAQAADAPEILARDAWGAKPPILERMTKQSPREIIIHHTSVKQQPKLTLERKLRGLQGYSQGPKKWGDSPYHYYIDASGRIGAARDVAYAGDTNTSYSVADRIQIVLEGHFDEEKPNAKQLASLRKLVAWLTALHKIGGDKISGHNDHTATNCPGKHLKIFLPELRQIADAKPTVQANE